MPYKSEKIKLSESQDKRIKLTKPQKEEIVHLYKTGNYSHQSLADIYGVSKSLIGLVVNDDRKQYILDYKNNNKEKYVQTKEQRRRYMKNWRKHKQELYLKGELVEDGKDGNDVE